MATTSIPRLPKKPITPYIRPDKRENKAMTVVLGLRFGDGIVLAADSQVTQQGGFKYNECKIFTDKIGKASIAIAYSGLPSLAREVREKLLERLAQTDVSESDVHGIANAVLDEMGRTYTDMNLQLLIGTTGDMNDVFNEPTLLKFDGKGLHKADSYNILGIGDSALLRYLADKLFSQWLPVKGAENLAIYFVEKAKQHIDGCGGQTDVVVLEMLNPSPRILQQDEIKERVKLIEKQESRIANLIARRAFSSPT